ncbi:MAG: MliC family protein [Patescibacteria group bacterium]
MKQIIATLVLLLLIAGGYVAWRMYGQGPSEVPVNIATFSCEQGKTIGAVFYSAKVELTLSDGRKLSLPQAISASGARYANADQSFVFWNKGNTAFIGEGKVEPQQETYTNCVTGEEGNTSSTTETTTYAYPPLGFSIKYPTTYVLNESYMYQGLGEEGIPGVKVSVPTTASDKTNLSSDSGVSIEYIPNAINCSASLFLYGEPAATTMTDGGVSYSVAGVTDAAAGNRYEEKVYALAGANPCIAVRYFIHSTELANYPAGTRVAFNKEQLLAEFDSIRHSLTLKNQSE